MKRAFSVGSRMREGRRFEVKRRLLHKRLLIPINSGATLPMTDHDIGPLGRPRRGVAIGTFLIWMIISGAAGAAAWGFYGNDVRTRLGIAIPRAEPAMSGPPAEKASDDDRTVALRELAAAQKHTADQLEAAIVLLNAQQAASKSISDSLATLGAKVDTLQHPPSPTPKPPTVTASRKPPQARGGPTPGPASAPATADQ